MTTKIEIDNLRLEYLNEETGIYHLAVQGLNLEVVEGEFLCIVGPSGCGKSTIISAIAGFLKPREGRLLVDAHPIHGPGADRGVVFQEYALLPWLRVIDNVAFGLKMKGLPKEERHGIARRFLELANLTGAEEKYPHELSGGMKQRAAVARTLANKPNIMLMDEPFAAVDAQTRMQLQEELIRMRAANPVTVLFVTHSVDEAVFLGDRVVVLTPGPGRVRDIVDIPIPAEDRTWSRIAANPYFAPLRDRVLALVRGQEEPP